MTLNYEVIHGLDFTDEDIAGCLRRGGLLSLELEFSKKCNLRCVYCYASAGEALNNELTLPELKDIILQAKDIGARKIILLGGGEPLLYDHVREVVEFIRAQGLMQSLFTNGMLITKDLAEFLFKNGVSVVVKRNSNIPEVQNMLGGIKDCHEKIQAGFDRLIEAGYPSGNTQLGIQTVICRQNLKEIPDLWAWARERGVIPYFEIITSQGRAKEFNKDLAVTNDELHDVFEKLKDIDENRFGHKWSPHPTIASFTCKRHLYSCLVNSQGLIQPCTGIDMPVGDLRKEKLKDILAKSPVIKNLRNIYTTIEGECQSCEFAVDCYGCRGNAYQSTGNYLASDPACWIRKNSLKAKKAAAGQ